MRKIQVANHELELNLKANYFYKFFLEITGVDLIENPVISDAKGIKSFDYAAAFIAAGHLAHSKVSGVEPKLTREQIEHEIGSMEIEKASTIVIELVTMMNGGDPNPQAPKKGAKKKAG